MTTPACKRSPATRPLMKSAVEGASALCPRGRRGEGRLEIEFRASREEREREGEPCRGPPDFFFGAGLASSFAALPPRLKNLSIVRSIAIARHLPSLPLPRGLGLGFPQAGTFRKLTKKTASTNCNYSMIKHSRSAFSTLAWHTGRLVNDIWWSWVRPPYSVTSRPSAREDTFSQHRISSAVERQTFM